MSSKVQETVVTWAR